MHIPALEDARRFYREVQPFIVDRIIDALEFKDRPFRREQVREADGRQLPSRPRPW